MVVVSKSLPSKGVYIFSFFCLLLYIPCSFPRTVSFFTFFSPVVALYPIPSLSALFFILYILFFLSCLLFFSGLDYPSFFSFSNNSDGRVCCCCLMDCVLCSGIL
jgi:hypothetical protein